MAASRYINSVPLLVFIAGSWLFGQVSAIDSRSPSEPPASRAAAAPAAPSGTSTDYHLGPEDQVHIHVVDMEDIPDRPMRIDPGGNLDLPLVGTLHAEGLTVTQLREELTLRLKKFVRTPLVNVTVTEFRSKSVTVLGAVNNAGVRQVEGPRSILEMISLAGGLRPDAGSTVTITRSKEAGPLPLKNARTALNGEYTVAQIDVDKLVTTQDPEFNIPVMPKDVITVSTAELVYVMGEVKKPGGYTLHSHETISALQALALAEGPQKTGSTKHARILRSQGEGKSRQEIATNLEEIIEGKKEDVPLQANDILVIPNNASRSATLRGIETAIQIGTGILIFHR